MDVDGQEQRVNPGGWRRRLLPALVAVGLVLVAAGVLVARAVGGGEPALIGTDLGEQPAPDFTLTDQRGEQVRLSDFRGKALVLTFIYTNCPDICPATAEHLRLAYEELPQEQQARVALLAVTVDPQRDDRAALQAFSAQHGLADNPDWFALTGTSTELEPVWRAYGIDPGAMQARMGPGHTDAVYLIDPQGRERVLLRSDLDPAALASDLAAETS